MAFHPNVIARTGPRTHVYVSGAYRHTLKPYRKTTMKKQLLNEMKAIPSPNRRRFLTRIATAGAVLGGAAGMSNAQSAAITDVDILNFALNLEYLEAEFYTAATTGKTLAQSGFELSGTGAAGDTTGGQMVDLSGANGMYSDIAKQIAADDQAHVKLIRGALQAAGAPMVAKPAINLAALGIGFGNLKDFLAVARALEDIGVSAYGGAAPLIQDKMILGVAARIALAEGEHVGNVRLQVAQLGIATTALDSLDFLPPPSGTKYFSLDDTGLSQVRTPGQVLFLAYGGKANATSGGFFPNGVNGTIKMSSDSATTTASNGTLAKVTPSTMTVSTSQIMVDGTTSISGSGALTYTYSVAPGGLQPAILQRGNKDPKAIIQFVNGPGLYNLVLTVKDAAGNTSMVPIALTYKPV
jgi:hypothetical protein